MMMERTIRFGIIGAGRIARQFCEAASRVDGVEVVAVASRTPGKAMAFAGENSLPASYDSYERMLERDDIDAVYVATTHNFHYENMLLAIEYGKHILCEKAFVLTREQAAEVFRRAEEKGLFCMEAMWSRFLPAVRRAKEWIDAGRLGEIDLANFVIGFKADPDPEGRMRNPKLAGGAMYDIGVYAIEIMTWLIPGQVRDVASMLTNTELGVDKVDAILLRFDNCVANLQAIMTCDVPNELNIYGTQGRIHMDNPHYADRCTLYDERGVAEEYFCRRDNGFEYEIAEFAGCVRAGKLESDVIPHRDTLLCAEIFDRCFSKEKNRDCHK